MQWQLQKKHMKMQAIDMEQEDPFRVGVIIGSGVGSLADSGADHEKILEKGPWTETCESVDLIPLMISNMAARKCIHSAWH